MISRPESLGEQYAARFQNQSVVDRYHLRPTYPPEIFTLLNALVVDEPRTVLDVGCGTGNVARPLANSVERVDAVDRSLPMLARARTLPGGDSPKIRWLHGRAEDVETQPPYALVTAGESLHWMDWGVVLPRFAREVSSHGVLAIVYLVDQPVSPLIPPTCPSIGSLNWRNISCSSNWANARPLRSPCGKPSRTMLRPSTHAAVSRWKP